MGGPRGSFKTLPNVFIIESLSLEDEDENRFEGRILSQILHLSGKRSVYYYIRTQLELEKMARVFGRGRFRYLHLSCHGNRSEMGTTLNGIRFDRLGRILRPHLRGRRVFLSACQMATQPLAEALLTNSGCYSVIGPATDVTFGDAAMLWSSFYHLMFKTNDAAMKRSHLLEHLKGTAQMFGVPLNYFSANDGSGTGIRFTSVDASGVVC